MAPKSSRITNGDVLMRLGENSEAILQLEKNLTRICDENKDSHAQILKRLDGVQGAISSVMTSHMEYHAKNEERWGAWTYMRNHMKVTIPLLVMTGLALAGIFGVTIDKTIEWVKTVNAAIK